MREEIKEVKSKGAVVGSCNVNIYETVEELIDNVDEKVILDMFNKANVIAAQAKERQAHAPAKLGKGKKMAMAFNLLSVEEMTSCAGDFEALQALAETKMPEVDAALAAAEGTEVVEEEVVTD